MIQRHITSQLQLILYEFCFQTNMESDQLGKRRRRRCAVVGCDRDTGQVTRPILLNPPPGQIEEWKRVISYMGRATKEFWICDSHFSDHQFHDEQRMALGLSIRRDRQHLKTTAVPDKNICPVGNISTIYCCNILSLTKLQRFRYI